MGLVQGWRKAGLAASMGLGLVVLTHAQTPVRLPSPPSAPSPASPSLREPLALANLVSGMIRFTRWPSNNNTVRLCILGHTGLLAQFPPLGPALVGPRSVQGLAIGLETDIRQMCDLVYFSALATEVQRAALRQVVGQPVLTLGEGPEFCSDGGMFCLEPVGGFTQRFSANLDAIARSSLRINPQVLRLAQPRPGTTP